MNALYQVTATPCALTPLPGSPQQQHFVTITSRTSTHGIQYALGPLMRASIPIDMDHTAGFVLVAASAPPCSVKPDGCLVTLISPRKGTTRLSLAHGG